MRSVGPRALARNEDTDDTSTAPPWGTGSMPGSDSSASEAPSDVAPPSGTDLAATGADAAEQPDHVPVSPPDANGAVARESIPDDVERGAVDSPPPPPDDVDTSDPSVAPSPSSGYVAKARSFGRFRLAQNFDEVVGVAKVIVNVNVGKPGPQVWFRVRSDEGYRLPVALLSLKEENETFIVDPSVVESLAAEIVPHVLFTYVTRQNVVGIWPVRLPRADGRTDGWMRSSHEAAQLAMTRWVRLQANRSGGAYDVNVTSAKLPEPEWPTLTFEELLEKAFADHVIESLDHPVLRRLRGEI